MRARSFRPVRAAPQQIFHAIETVFPQLAVVVEPAVDVAQRLELDTAEMFLGCPAAGHEARLFQYADMLGDSANGEREGLRQFGDRGFAVEQPGEDCPSRRVGEGGESVVEGE